MRLPRKTKKKLSKFNGRFTMDDINRNKIVRQYLKSHLQSEIAYEFNPLISSEITFKTTFNP